MKTKTIITQLCIMLISIVFFTSCKKKSDDPAPSTTTTTPTPSGTTVTDVDGNTYNTVTIGKQTWMKEDLKVTKYKDGTPIPNLTGSSTWATNTNTSGAYSDNSNTAYSGKFYNWAAMVDSRGICPNGWHVPTDAEVDTLVAFLEQTAWGTAGGQMKSTTSDWQSPNLGATNSSGFTGLPFGILSDVSGINMGYSTNGYYWTATQYDANNGAFYGLYYNAANLVNSYQLKKYGAGCRCLKD